MPRPDVLIIGGGVIGASTAYYLAEQGTRVTLLERGRAGGHASLASAGLLHPMQSADVPAPLRASPPPASTCSPTSWRDYASLRASTRSTGQ